MNFYATPDYLDVIAKVYYKGRRASIEDIRIGSDVLRLLVIDGKHVITSAQFLDYHEPLVTSEIGTITRGHHYANFVVRDVVPAAQWHSIRRNEFELSPFIDWSMFPHYSDYVAYVAKHNKSFFRTMDRRRRRLETTFGEIVFTMNDRQDDVLETARLWKKRQLRNSGEIDYYADPKTMECLDLLRRNGSLVSATLRAGGRLVSLDLGFIHDGIWSSWVSAYDPNLRQYSCGHQLTIASLEASHRLGHRQFDFSIGGEDYKQIYATHIRLLGTIGRQPLAHSIYLHMKQQLRERNPRLFTLGKDTRKAFFRTKSICQSWLYGTELSPKDGLEGDLRKL